MQIRKLIVAAGMSLIFVSTYSAARSEDAAASLWKIQKVLVSKKYVALTHEFAPDIPRWPGFPDETRKTETEMSNAMLAKTFRSSDSTP